MWCYIVNGIKLSVFFAYFTAKILLQELHCVKFLTHYWSSARFRGTVALGGWGDRKIVGKRRF